MSMTRIGSLRGRDHPHPARRDRRHHEYGEDCRRRPQRRRFSMYRTIHLRYPHRLLRSRIFNWPSTITLASLAAGDLLTYTFGYTNTGSQDATGVVLTATLPANTTFNASESSVEWTQDAADEPFYLPVGDLAAGADGTAVFAITVGEAWPAGVDSLSSVFEIADDGTNGADPTPGNNEITQATALDAAPDLSITKDTGGVESVIPGGTLIYTLQYANNGQQDATSVVITETLPISTTFDPASSSAGWQPVEDTDQYRYSIGNVQVGGSYTLTFGVVVTSNPSDELTSIHNQVILADDGQNGIDPTPGDNATSATTSINLSPDLTLGMSGDGTTQPGSIIRYTLTYGNQGFTGASGVVIEETLPESATFNEAEIRACTRLRSVPWPLGQKIPSSSRSLSTIPCRTA